jgi:hypothetical protein
MEFDDARAQRAVKKILRGSVIEKAEKRGPDSRVSTG